MVFFLIKAVDMYLIYLSISASATLSHVPSDLAYDLKLPLLIRNSACWFVAIQWCYKHVGQKKSKKVDGSIQRLQCLSKK